MVGFAGRMKTHRRSSGRVLIVAQIIWRFIAGAAVLMLIRVRVRRARATGTGGNRFLGPKKRVWRAVTRHTINLQSGFNCRGSLYLHFPLSYIRDQLLQKNIHGGFWRGYSIGLSLVTYLLLAFFLHYLSREYRLNPPQVIGPLP